MGNQGNKGKSKKQDKFEKDEKKEQQKKRAEGSDMEEKQIETELIRETGAVSLERNNGFAIKASTPAAFASSSISLNS